MHAHGLVQSDRRLQPRARRNGLVQLGWPHFWLLAGTLGGLLALVALTYFIAYFPAQAWRADGPPRHERHH